MGAAIAMDVMIATFTRARQFDSARKAASWTALVATTHTLFPMIGYYSVAFYLSTSTRFQSLIGASAAVAIGWLVVTSYLEWRSGVVEEQHTNLKQLALVISVSWDALLSGPAKAAQAKGWSPSEIFFSFLVVGLVVFGATIASVYVALRYHRKMLGRRSDNQREAGFHIAAFAVELGLIAYFGLLAVDRLVLDINLPWAVLLAAALLAAGLIVWVDRIALVKGRKLQLDTLAP